MIMKKILLTLLAIPTLLFAQHQATQIDALTPGVQFIAASSTNVTTMAGTAYEFKTEGAPRTITLWGRASGLTAQATNAAGNATLTVIFGYSANTNSTHTYDSPTTSQVRLAIPLNGIVTNSMTEYSVPAGRKWIKIIGAENTSLGTVTNFNFGVAYDLPK
jgi:hypothetical protein